MFVAGILSILLSVVLIALEVRVSQRAVSFEVQRVLRLAGQPGRVTRTALAETIHP
jgi:extradiol dioxygenase family protein